MNRDSFIVRVKIDNIYKVIIQGVKASYDLSNFELIRLLPKESKKNLTIQ